MNKNELVSHVADETSATRATAERMVGVVFSAIGDALARDEPVAIAGFGKFVIRGRAARRGRNPQTGEPVAIAASKVPSFKAAKAFETRSTDSVAGQAAPPFVPATPPPQVRAFAMHTRRSARPGSQELPLRLPQADRRAHASRIAWSPDALHAEGDRTGVGPHSPGLGTFVVNTRNPGAANAASVRRCAPWQSGDRTSRRDASHRPQPFATSLPTSAPALDCQRFQSPFGD